MKLGVASVADGCLTAVRHVLIIISLIHILWPSIQPPHKEMYDGIPMSKGGKLVINSFLIPVCRQAAKYLLLFPLWLWYALSRGVKMRNLEYNWRYLYLFLANKMFVGWLLNVPATCWCISRMNLLTQLYVLPHWDGSCRSNFLSHSVTVYWQWANQ